MVLLSYRKTLPDLRAKPCSRTSLIHPWQERMLKMFSLFRVVYLRDILHASVDVRDNACEWVGHHAVYLTLFVIVF